jgi:hypothetical protein
LSELQPPPQQASRGKSGRAKLGLALVIILVTVVPVGIAFGPAFCADMEARDILENGVSAQARVIDYYDTGNRYNHNPEVVVTLEVQPAGGQPYRAEVNTVLSAVELAKKPVGSMVNVKYDPADHSRVALFPW